jgi:predicted RNA-binding protein with TRAM domain
MAYGQDNERRSFAPVKVGEELDVKIEAVGEKGDGVCKKNGFVLFVPGAKEGQDVKIRVTKVLRRVGFAEIIGNETKKAKAEKPKKGKKTEEEELEEEQEEEDFENKKEEEIESEEDGEVEEDDKDFEEKVPEYKDEDNKDAEEYEDSENFGEEQD